jgi:hypothetical protein
MVVGVVGAQVDHGAEGLIDIIDRDDIAAAGQGDLRKGGRRNPVADLAEAGRHLMALTELVADGHERQRRLRRDVDGQRAGAGNVGLVVDGVGPGEAGRRDVGVGTVRVEIDLAAGRSPQQLHQWQDELRAGIVRQHAMRGVDDDRRILDGIDLFVLGHSGSLRRRPQTGGHVPPIRSIQRRHKTAHAAA